ncbi:MAG: FAD/NAD(P)-binding protein [Thiotrichales bacterium]
MMHDPYLPNEVEVVERIQESTDIFTLRLRFTDPELHSAYGFAPGQFNMLYLYGVGEVPISIVSDVEDEHMLDHTIRSVGRVTDALAQVQSGERLGIRGPFGKGWPLEQAGGKDVLILTGGLGCAPAVSVIRHVLRRRDQFGRLTIMQGVKHSDDLIWRADYEQWAALPNTQVLLAADVAAPNWIGQQGLVTTLLDEAKIDFRKTIVMMCGPEPMMIAAANKLLEMSVPAESLWLSMERNMHCGVGHCGHCQFGGHFVCKDGPVFNYPDIASLFGKRGF